MKWKIFICSSQSYLLLITSLIFFACRGKSEIPTNIESNNNHEVLQKVQSDNDYLNNKIKEECKNEINEMIQIRDKIMNKIFNAHVSPDILKREFLSKDRNRILNLIGYSEVESKIVQLEIEHCYQQMYAKIPEIKELANQSMENICSECNIENFFDKKYAKLKLMYDQKNKDKTDQRFSTLAQESGDNCKWIQLSLCLTTCALLADVPPLYAVCAYTCLCGYCTGPSFVKMGCNQ